MTSDTRPSRSLLFAATDAFQLKTLVLPVVPGLLERGWQVRLASSGHLDADAYGVTHSSLRMTRRISPAADFLAFIRWLRLIGRTKPDVVVSGSPKASLLALTAARLMGVRTRIYLVRGLRWESEKGVRRRIMVAMEAVTIGSATASIAVSPSVAQTVRRNVRSVESPIVLGRGGSKGVDLKRFRFAEIPDELFEHPRIGFLGRLSRDKGIQELLDVFRIVRTVVPSAELAIFGPADVGQPISSSLLNEIRQSDAITWSGETNDPPRALSSCTLMLFPSVREGLPNAVLEASACGLPVVAWDAPGVRDAVLPGVTGVLVPPYDCSAMAEAVVSLLRNPERSRRMGRAGRAMVEAHYSEALVVRRFLDLLDRESGSVTRRGRTDAAR